MDMSGSDSESLPGDCDGEHITPSNQQQQQPGSSSGKMKMKHLGLSNTAAASRFRLTFDETADVTSNRNIKQPHNITPHPRTRNTSGCNRVEPELPFADTKSSKPSGDSDSDVYYYGNEAQPCVHDDVLPSTNVSKQKHISAAHSPTHVRACHESTPDTSTTTNAEKHCYSSLLLEEPLLNTKSDEGKNLSSAQVQFQNEEDQPQVTICLSNYQGNGPHTPESATFDFANNNGHQLDVLYSQRHNNNNQCIKESCFGDYPEATSTGGYDRFMKEKTCYHSDNSGGLTNGCILTESNRHCEPLLQHRDTASAPPLHDSYRYHVFFSHCQEDREWVEHTVAHLEAPPFNYTCAYASLEDDLDPGNQQQRILCAAMLSERVVIVLSRRYVDETWRSFEKILKQLTKMSLHNQRIMGVLLEDCHIPESLAELYFMDCSDPDFFHVFTRRLKTSVSNGTILTFCRLQVKVGWNSYLVPADETDLDIPPSLSGHGIGMESAEFEDIVSKVSGIIKGSNKLPWILSAQPLAALLLACGLWLPAFISVLVIHVDDDSGIALPGRLTVFLFPLGLVACGYLIKWRRSYWLTKIVRLLVQNCVDVNQAFYFQGRPVFVTAAHLRANVFTIYFVYFDATDCVRSVDLLLFSCLDDDWEKLLKLITFYSRDENYLSRMSLSERLTVMMSAPYLVKLVKQMLPHPPQQRHVTRLLCLCQFTEECMSRFAHGLDREDVPGLAELFTRHMPGKVSGSAIRRVQEELFHANHGLVP